MRLHRKHGFNPTIRQCFFCGEDTSEIVLLGAAHKGQAPMHMVISYEPCDKCKAQMALGITLIEAEPSSDRPPINEQSAVSPTGRWWVVTEDAVRNMPIPDAMRNGALKMRKLLIQPEVAKLMGLYDIPARKAPT